MVERATQKARNYIAQNGKRRRKRVSVSQRDAEHTEGGKDGWLNADMSEESNGDGG